MSSGRTHLGIPGVARALAIGGVAQSAMFARYDALVRPTGTGCAGVDRAH